MRPLKEETRLEVEGLPGLDTEVAIAGSAQQQEVGGAICLGILGGVAVYVAAG